MAHFFRRFLFRRFRKAGTADHQMSYLFWECTSRCNFSCLHCGSDCSKDSSHEDMPMADFLRALDTIERKADNFIVVLTGGEPLLRHDIEDCGREIRRRGLRWGLVTNGYLYDYPKHISLLQCRIRCINHKPRRDGGES